MGMMALTLALLESASLFAAVYGAIVIWGHPVMADWADVASVLGQAGLVSLGCLVAFYFNDFYDLRIVRSFGQFAPRLIESVGIAFIILAALDAVVFRGRVPARSFVSGMILVAGFVVLIRAVSYGVIRSAPFQARTLIVGLSPLTNKLIAEIEAQPHLRCAIVGVADDGDASGTLPARYQLLGPLAHLDKIVAEVRPDRIIIGLGERRGRLPVRQLMESRVRGTIVEDGVRVYERLTGKLAIESLTPSAVVFSDDFRKSRVDLIVGRLVSLAVATVGLIVLAPLCGLIALAIKLDSRGPVLFMHERVGLNGRRFELLKFRTMHPAGGKTSEWVRDNSDRITRVGRWLRKCRLDEVPQFVNVLRGEMNLVGPRPHPVSNYELFGANIPYYSLRCLVRPGVTGWAQVRYGYANDLHEEIEKMRYDLYYIKHLSLEFDLRIIFETFKIVLVGREGQP
jgi:exopolysaccharide biosynthesis polyprenyl glycosylphosphotransferase